MQLIVEYVPPLQFARNVLKKVEQEVLSWNNGLTLEMLGKFQRFELDNFRFSNGYHLAGTVCDKDGFLWRPKFQKGQYESWNPELKSGKQYRVKSLVHTWWLNKVDPSVFPPQKPPKKADQQLPATAVMQMKRLRLVFEDGSSWDEDVEYEVQPHELLFYFVCQTGWVGIKEV